MGSEVTGARDPTEAIFVIRGIANGRLNAEDVLGQSPLMVVDLDGDGSRGSAPLPAASAPLPASLPPPSFGRPPFLRLPTGFGRVIVGVSHRAPTTTVVDCDVALTSAPDAPRPWVSVADLSAAVHNLRAQVEVHPVASLIAAQLLRRRGAGTPDDDLLCESLAYSTLQGGPEFGAWLGARTRSPRRSVTNPPVVVERTRERLVVTLDRPEVRNAYDAAMRDHLIRALQLVVADRSIRTVLLRGAGLAFCSGGDLDEFGTATDPSSAHVWRLASSAGWWLARCSSRVTASLHGGCIGAGIELPAFAGRVVAAPDTVIRLPEIAMGLVPGAGGTVSIPRRIGRHRTAWLALSGASLPATTALSWGLVDHISPEGDAEWAAR